MGPLGHIRRVPQGHKREAPGGRNYWGPPDMGGINIVSFRVPGFLRWGIMLHWGSTTGMLIGWGFITAFWVLRLGLFELDSPDRRLLSVSRGGGKVIALIGKTLGNSGESHNPAHRIL